MTTTPTHLLLGVAALLGYAGAAALYLSPRTVEKHVERLLLKTGAANRTALAALFRTQTAAP